MTSQTEKAEHTAGPWKFHGNDLRAERDGFSSVLATLWPIAGRDDETRGNRRLIAAAPSLYEALRQAEDALRAILRHSTISDQAVRDDGVVAAREARAAIKLVEGA